MSRSGFTSSTNDSTRSEAEWGRYPARIYENMERIFRILDDTDTKATFFVIGWIAGLIRILSGESPKNMRSEATR